MARRSFIFEIRHLLLWGVFAGLVEGTVSAVIVSKTFHAGILLITVVQATPAFANLISLLWGVTLLGRRKLPVLFALGAAAVVVVSSVAATPMTAWGGWIFAGQVAMSRLFLSGVVEARASTWKSNYPRTHRGRITAALQIVRTIGSLPVILGAGLLFDANPAAYRWFYPAVAVVGALALILYRHARVRGERRALRRPPAELDALANEALGEPFSLVSMMKPWHIVRRMRRALGEDTRFARYIQAQMCIGSANLMVMPVNTIILTKVMKLSYTSSNVLIDVIPRFITLGMLPIWAHYFDRVGVLRFRVFNSMCWSLSVLVAGVGAAMAIHANGAAALLSAAIAVYSIGRVFDGLAQSGGAIAWNIGHLHFAEDNKAELYMGIHVSLTGLRGLTAPFIGALLYEWISYGVFGVSFAVAITGLILFRRLAHEEKLASRSEAELHKDKVGARDRVGKPADLVRR